MKAAGVQADALSRAAPTPTSTTGATTPRPAAMSLPTPTSTTSWRGVQRAGAQPMVIANYGTGTPQEAADWVRYANVTKGYGVKYWEIGNELYGNGHYGAAWEADDHADKSPADYATNVKEFAAGDEGGRPDRQDRCGPHHAGQLARRHRRRWRRAAPGTRSCCRSRDRTIDFVILHWYPGGSNGPEALTKTEPDHRRHLARPPADRPVRRRPTRWASR